MKLQDIKRRYHMCLKIQSIISDGDDHSDLAQLLRKSVDMKLINDFIEWCEDSGVHLTDTV